MRSPRFLSVLLLPSIAVAFLAAQPAEPATRPPLSSKALFAAECSCPKTKCDYYASPCLASNYNKQCTVTEEECSESDCDTGTTCQ